MRDSLVRSGRDLPHGGFDLGNLVSREVRQPAFVLQHGRTIPGGGIVDFRRQDNGHRVIMPVSGVHQGTLAALRYSRILSDDVTAVHVTIEPADAEKVRQKWKKWGEGVRLVMLDSPYRLFIEPLLTYIADIAQQRQPGETITIVVPKFVSNSSVNGVLHTNTADLLRTQLMNQRGIIVTSVPYHVDEKGEIP